MRGPKAAMSSTPSAARLTASERLRASDWNNGMTILCRHWSGARRIWFTGARFCRVSATSLLHRRLGTGLSLIRQQPPRVLHRHGAEFVQLLDLRILESNSCRVNIV